MEMIRKIASVKKIDLYDGTHTGLMFLGLSQEQGIDVIGIRLEIWDVANAAYNNALTWMQTSPRLHQIFSYII